MFSLGANTSSSPHVLKQSIGFYQWVDHTRLVTEVKTRIWFSRLGKGCYLTSSVTPLIQFNSPGLALWIKCRRSGCTPGCKHTRLFVYSSCRHHRCHLWNSFRLAEIQMFRWSWNIRQILNTERLLLPESGVTPSTFRVTHPVKLASTVRLTDIKVLKITTLFFILRLNSILSRWKKSQFDNSVTRDRRF